MSTEMPATNTYYYPHTPFSIVCNRVDNGTGYWSSYRIEVFRDGLKIGAYTRNYSSFATKTFCPFQHKGTWYALYSEDYTATRVARLTDKFEDWCGEDPDGSGFCPVDFYVPRGAQEEYTNSKGEKQNFVCWFDAEYDNDEEFAKDAGEKSIVWANYGFLSGCHWGDDSSWKLRYIDLSEIENRVLKIQSRFGYWELACNMDIRKSVRIYDYGSFCLAGAFHMNLNKKVPNAAFNKQFFVENDNDHVEANETKVMRSLLDLIKSNRLVLSEYMGPEYIDKEIKKAEAVLKNDA